ncbi:MAG: hypothetical protein MJZ49_08205 [Bacteroidales bacterium]|nr:hypothetical protein [Bacteroidales bacterium]
MPVEFLHETGDNSKDYKLLMAYDGSGRRISKTRYAKDDQFGYWYLDHVTHYTGIGTEVREAMRRSASPEVKVVVNLPQGLGRYGVEDAEKPSSGNATFEWYLKNHLGATMLVYGTQGSSNADVADLGEVKKAYDYRSFGEQIDLIADAGDKVTENFTGIRLRGECCEHACMFIAEPMGLGAKRKERDDETELNYFGARYLDPMLGLWTSVDPKRQFASPYLYAGNGVNPISSVDNEGNYMVRQRGGSYEIRPMSYSEATVGWVIRDVAVAAASIVGAYLLTTGTAAAAFVGGSTALYGATKGFVTGGTNRLGGASIGIGEAGAQHVTERIIIEGSAAVGKTMAVGLNAFEALLGASDLYSKVDDEAFIEDFNNSFANCNNGGDCNSFPTQRAAEEFAEGLGGGRVDVGDIIVEKE